VVRWAGEGGSSSGSNRSGGGRRGGGGSNCSGGRSGGGSGYRDGDLLSALGVPPGARVGIMIPNGVDLMAALVVVMARPEL